MPQWHNICRILYETRSTRRAHTSLAEANHDSHIAHCKNVETWGWKANPKGSGSLPAPRAGHTTAILWCVSLIYSSYTEDPDHHHNLITSLLYHPEPLHKISAQSIHKVLSNVHKQTDRQTSATKNVTSFCQVGNNRFAVTSMLCSNISCHKVSLLTFSLMAGVMPFNCLIFLTHQVWQWVMI